MAEDWNHWDRRYHGERFLFGTEPAAFLTRHTEYLKPDLRALAVADGEGRNSVFMAAKGMNVVAMDSSSVGLGKARALAAKSGVAVDFRLADIATWDWTAERFDLIAAIFIQFAGPSLRADIFAGMRNGLKPGGTLLLHGYTPEQVDLGTGGPPHRENMYTEYMLRHAFGDWNILRLEAYEAIIDEGEGHSGKSALIDLIVQKPG